MKKFDLLKMKKSLVKLSEGFTELNLSKKLVMEIDRMIVRLENLITSGEYRKQNKALLLKYSTDLSAIQRRIEKALLNRKRSLGLNPTSMEGIGC